jgi:adenylate cyclase
MYSTTNEPDDGRSCFHPVPLGVEQSVSIFFSDINGYTPFAESLAPHDVIRMLRHYFEGMGAIVQGHGGRVIDYYGDGLLAVFGLDNCQGSAWQAVQAALQMQAAMGAFNEQVLSVYHAPLSVRIGIHYGEVVVGEVGHEQMRKLAVIGDTVNLASRIEQANKALQTRLLISESAFRQVQAQVDVWQTFEVNLRGKTGLYKLYALDC